MLIHPHSFRKTPWRNGLGVTSEIARMPEEGAVYDWRVSIAQLDRSSDFSTFPGMMRLFVLLTGNVDLTIGDRAERTDEVTPVQFSGEDPVFCRVHEPATALNVIWSPAAGRAEVSLATEARLDDVVLLYGSTATLLWIDGKRMPLPAGSALRLDDAKYGQMTSSREVLAVKFRR